MADLDDSMILQWIEMALESRRCICYVHWEPDARQEIIKDAQISPEAVNEAIGEAFIDGMRPKIETQKGGPFDGEDRYVWRIKVEDIELYVKTSIELDRNDEPELKIVRCHKGWY